ncbi:MAG: hypothetical protein INR62_04175 [Rhodospirillales bacterium]|nr:hypothetical protein [Acetobacter sp.]
MNRYDNPMTERAVKAHLQRAASLGHSPAQPSSGSSGRESNLVTLRNVSGTLARYKVCRNRKTGAEYIRFLD